MAVHLHSERRINRTVSRLPGVKAAIAAEATRIGARAKARLESHRDPTNATDHQIEVDFGRVDAFVSLVGPAPLSVEFGHWYTGNLGGSPKYVPGLYILMGASGLI
jgi:hypothetical protein